MQYLFYRHRYMFSVVMVMIGLFSGWNKANANSVSLVMNQMKVIKPSERSGDELFFDLLVVSTHRKPFHVRVPSKPHHWPMFVLPKLKDVLLWKTQLAEGENIKLVISLIEKDAEPWDINDHLGSIRLYLHYPSKGLEYAYTSGEEKQINYQPIAKGHAPEVFNFSSKHGQYKVFFKLRVDNSSS